MAKERSFAANANGTITAAVTHVAERSIGGLSTGSRRSRGVAARCHWRNRKMRNRSNLVPHFSLSRAAGRRHSFCRAPDEPDAADWILRDSIQSEREQPVELFRLGLVEHDAFGPRLGARDEAAL